MGSPITFSGFNNIDFGAVLNAIMQQERQPELALQQKQTTLQSQTGNIDALNTKLAALETAAASLAKASSLSGRSASVTDPTSVTFTPGAATPTGTYDIVVQELARAQVTQSSTTYADKDTTVVASGGTLTLGGVAVTVSGNTTLQELADLINGTEDIAVTATVVKASATSYRLVLTGLDTGAANSFAISNSLTGGAGVTFGANAVDATDAQVLVNNVVATSAGNTFDDVVTGASFTVLRKDPASTVSVTLSQDTSAAKTLIDTFVAAYNDLVSFVDGQRAASAGGDAGSLGRDGILRNIGTALRGLLSGANTADDTYQYLATVGLGFSRSGQLTFDAATFDVAAEENLTHVQNLFTGAGGTDGVFAALQESLDSYTASDGVLSAARARMQEQIASIGRQIDDFEARLAVRREALQREFAAADQAISLLNRQSGSLSSLGSQYRLF